MQKHKTKKRTEKKLLLKRKPLPKLKKEAWGWFSKWIRLRDALLTTGTKEFVKCVTCDKVASVKEMDAGHFKHNRFDYDERNIHAQCSRCNHFLSGNGAVYAIFILDTYGREVLDYLTNNKETRIVTREDYERIIDYYKEEFENMLENN